MARQVKDLLEVSLTEKVNWFPEQIWDGELSAQERGALRQVMQTTLEQ